GRARCEAHQARRMALELFLLPRGAAASRLPVLVHAAHGHGRDRGARSALPELPPPVAQPRLAPARRRPVPQRPRDRGGGTHVRRGRDRDARRIPGRALVGLVRRAETCSPVIRVGTHLEVGLRRSTCIGQRNEVKRMRRYGLYDMSRGLTLAFAAALAGLGLWGAAQVGTQTAGRLWVAMAVVAGSRLLVALAHHVGTWTKGLRLRLSPSTFVLAFLPVLVVVGWLLIANQPGNGWEEGRIDSWSNSLGILGVMHSVGLWRGVLAFGLGLVLGLALDGVP